MNANSLKQTSKNLARWVWGIIALAGCAATTSLLVIPSESSNCVLWGLSRLRLTTVLGSAALTALIIAWVALDLTQPQSWRAFKQRHQNTLRQPGVFFGLVFLLWMLLAALGLFFVGALSPAAKEITVLAALLQRYGGALAWVGVCAAALLWSLYRLVQPASGFFTPLRWALLFTGFTVVYYLSLKFFGHSLRDYRFSGLEDYLFLPAVLWLALGALSPLAQKHAWAKALCAALLPALLAALAFTVYWNAAQWVGWKITPNKAYWHELAGAFLQGRLYLISPETTHDLTFFNGRWYVPNPPLPALVLMPFVALWGVAEFNTVYFSAIVGGLNVALVYLILQRASHENILPTQRANNLWLTALFACGTTHWWLSMMGRMWFVSQLLTFTCGALAVYLALRRAGPAWVGLFLGLAMLSRPNAFTLWPLAAGIVFFLTERGGQRVTWKQALGWTVASAAPMALAVAGLLGYNYVRFGNFFDFGYVTITSAKWLTDAVRTYGMFNPHFLPANLYAMFIKLPQMRVENGCWIYSPSREGISMIAMTPALLYAVRRVRLQSWSIGALGSIVASIGLLALYHNTGAWQLGYRYLLDFLLPVWFMLAAALGEKRSWVFRALVCLSIAGNLLGVVWWFNKWWC